MKIKSYILLVTLYLFSFNVSAQEKEVTSAIREVTVFFQGAQVSRTSADFSLTKGQTVVVFKGLEQAIMENSIRAGVKGNARILNIMKSTDFLDQQQSNAKIEQLKKELDGIDREIELENAHARVYGQEKDLLLANMKLGGVNNGVETAQIREAAAFYRLKLTEIEEGQLAIKDKIKTLGEKRKNILAQLNELNYQKNMPSGRIEITVEADAAGTYGILLSYLVTTASWYPSYDIRIEEVGDAVNIIRKANLTQSTGLDWNNVTLGFSTGNPMRCMKIRVG